MTYTVNQTPDSAQPAVARRGQGTSGRHRGDLAARIHSSFWGLLVPIDVIVVTPEDLEEYADCPYTVIEPALREGKVIYAATVPQSSQPR